MRLIKFRIQNYKSIVDTGFCFLASDLTILIGKNESGKTATLEALRYFNKNMQRVSEDAFPMDAVDREPMVELWVRPSREDLQEIQTICGYTLPERVAEDILNNGVGLTKNCRGQYALSASCVRRIFEGEIGAQDRPAVHIQTAKDKLQELLKTHVPSINFQASGEDIQRSAKELVRTVKSFLPSIKDEQLQAQAVEAIRIIIRESGRLTQPVTQAGEGDTGGWTPGVDHVALFTECLVDRLPHLIFFTEFSDILPFEIPIDRLKENQAVLDFAKIAGLDLDAVMNTPDTQKRINLLNRYSAIISGDFLDYWGQDEIELVVKPEGEKLLFGVKEKSRTDFFKVEQRSKGLQWFLSFYLRLNAQKSKENVIIIDEPGVHLHARAQKEIIKILEREIVAESQVIFSTHCPYLIDPQRLDRIRLVVKDPQKGTYISADLQSRADEESLLPVLTAMGGLTVPAPSFGAQNVIVEGAADYYIWEALKNTVKDLNLEKMRLLPAADTEHMLQLVAVMIGQGADFQVLLNHDTRGRQAEECLKKRFALGDNKIFFISAQDGYAVEDLFTLDDFYGYVLRVEGNGDQNISNSQYLKAKNINRTLAAREFFDAMQRRTSQSVLSDRTVSSFRDVFKRILERFRAFEELNAKPRAAKQSFEAAPNPESKILRGSLFAFLKQK